MASSESFRDKEQHDLSNKLAPFSGFFKKSFSEKHSLLNSYRSDLDLAPLDSGGLRLAVANIMIENCVGLLGLPLGIVPTVVVNNQHYIVPMCVEEPSVVAAASGAAKLIAENGGFSAQSTSNIMTGQIQLLDISDCEAAVRTIEAHRKALISAANRFCTSMTKRGGGVSDVSARIIGKHDPTRAVCSMPYIVIHFQVDVCESMGANLVNTIAEGLAPDIVQLTGGRAGLKILTNLCTERMVLASFRIPVSLLTWKGVDGSQVAERILEAYYFAVDDPFRATTNNKGIMNGIDAVAIATGQDWRALEAAAHSYAARSGQYQSLTNYSIQKDDNDSAAYLTGSIKLPVSVGTVGGALQTHPIYKFSHQLLGHPDARTLAQIIASVGLAQNFAAIRALAVEGIQRGHMALHARQVAAAAGVPPELVPEVALHMIENNKIHRDAALEYMIKNKNIDNTSNL